MKISHLAKWLGMLVVAFASIAAVGQALPPEDPDQYSNTVLDDVLSRNDNIMLSLVESIWGGGTITEQTPNLLGTLSAVIATFLGTAIFIIMVYKAFMWVFRTGLAGEAGGDAGPTRVSFFWSSIVPVLALLLVTPLGSSGYAPVQYLAHGSMTSGIWLADKVALTGVQWFLGGNGTSGSADNKTYIASGGTATRAQSAETEILFQEAAIKNACRVSANTDLRPKNEHVVLRQVSSNSSQYNPYKNPTVIFSYELETIGQNSPNPVLNGFCGQIKLTQSGREVPEIGGITNALSWMVDGDYDNSGMYEEKFSQDTESIYTFLIEFGDVATVYEGRYTKGDNERNIEKIAASLEVKTQELAEAIEDGANEILQGDLESSVDALSSELIDATALEAGSSDWLKSQTNAYKRALDKLNTSLNGTAARLVAEYENIAVENISFTEELERRGIVVLGAQYWGVTQLSARARELSKVEILPTEATLSSGAWSDGVRRWSGSDYSGNIDREAMRAAMEDIFTSARPFDRNEVLTARGAGYKARRSGENGEDTVYTDDQAGILPYHLANMAFGATKHLITLEDNLILTTQTLGEWVATFGWTAFILQSDLNPFSSNEGDGLVSRLAKGVAAGAAAVVTTGATGGAAFPMAFMATVAAVFGELLSLIAVPCMVIGAFMTYYIPSMPAIYFYMALFGIIIIFIEAIIVLPIWTVMLCLTAGEEGWETAHMRQGIVLLLGLMARLTGNVMIFFAVIMLLETAAPLFVTLMVDVYLSIFSTSTAGIVGWLFCIACIALFAYQIIIRSFSLLTELMDMIMRGLNVGHQTFGSQGDEEKGRSMLIGVMQRTGGKMTMPRSSPAPTPGDTQ